MILIFVDSKWRDAKSMTSLSKKLNSLSVPTVLTSFDNWQTAIKLQPRVVVLNHLMGNRNKDIASYVQSYGGKVAILPTEGRPNNKAIEKWFYSEDTDYDLWMDWNDSYSNSVSTSMASKHVVTGCPRFDVYSNGNHKSRTETLQLFNIPLDKTVCLVTSSFPQAKFALTSSRFNKYDWKDLGRTDSDDNVLNEKRALDMFMSTIDLLVKSKLDYEFIIRPHPMESAWIWEQFCEKNSNCTLITQLPIEDLLYSSDILVNRAGCITFYDGVLSGLEKIYTLNVDGRHLDGAELEAYVAGIGFDTAGQFLMFSHIESRSDASIDTRIVSKHINYIGEATDRVASELAKLYSSSTVATTTPSILNYLEKKRETNTSNAYPNIDQLHTGKVATDGALTGIWLSDKELE